jgi:hypothetical protein
VTSPWHPPDTDDPAGQPPEDPGEIAPVHDIPVQPRRPGAGRWLRELLWALGVAIGVSVLGFPLGWWWAAITPGVEVVMTSQGVWYAPTPRFEEAAAGDGWFVLITAGAGVVIAIVVWLVARRYRGPVVLVGLAVGSVACAVIAAWFGHRTGLAGYERWLRTATVGQHYLRPANVGTKRIGLWHGVFPLAQGAVLLQAAAAVTLYTMLAGFHRAPSLRDEDGRAIRAGRLPDELVSSDWSAYPAPAAAPAPPVPGTAAAPPD